MKNNDSTFQFEQSSYSVRKASEKEAMLLSDSKLTLTRRDFATPCLIYFSPKLKERGIISLAFDGSADLYEVGSKPSPKLLTWVESDNGFKCASLIPDLYSKPKAKAKAK